MIKVMFGGINKCNSYRLEEIYSNYPKALIYFSYSMRSALKFVSNMYRPITNDRVLIVVKEKHTEFQQDGTEKVLDYRRSDFDDVIEKVEELSEHEFIDIVWIIDNKRLGAFNNIISKVDMIYLRNTFKEDFLKYLDKDLLNRNKSKIVARRVGYSLNKYEIYRETLIANRLDLSDSFIKSLISKTNMSYTDLAYQLTQRNKKALKEYYRLGRKYSYNHINSSLVEIYKKVIVIKDDMYSGDKKVTNMFNGENFKYTYLAKDTKKIELYTLQMLIERNLNNTTGVEIYYKYPSKSFLDYFEFLEI